MSAPIAISEKSIENFIRLNLGWIKKQQEKYLNQPRKAERKYVSGETYYIWNKQYFLEFQPSKKRYFKIEGNKLLLGMKKDSTVQQREKFVRKEYRRILVEQLFHLIPKWEEITGLKCESWNTKYMLTKWGSCNSFAKRIWINLQIVEKPLECLEYVVLHELIHLKVSNHGKDFTSELERFMPDWKERKKSLNKHNLDYFKDYKFEIP